MRGRSRTCILLLMTVALTGAAPNWTIEIEQLTHGPRHHFFGYIGHVQNIPWNASGKWIVALRTTFQDHLPKPNEAAEVILIEAANPKNIVAVDQTRAWNFQQGTMLYWNPRQPETQFFFNDRDPGTNKLFAVLYDIRARKRIHEFRYDDTPFGNSGVAQKGAYFLGLNYGRLARLRPVTGYPEAHDWNPNEPAPSNDGIFLVDLTNNRKRLLVSYRQLAAAIRPLRPDVDGKQLFINHTLSNRDDNRIYFYVRGDFGRVPGKRIDMPCSIRPDGSGLAVHERHIGGHPEWEFGSKVIGQDGGRQILYDVDRKEIVGQIGTPEIFPQPGGDAALSPDGQWLVNGYRKNGANYYSIFHRADGSFHHTQGFAHPGFTSGDLRVDGAPTWNRTNDQILFPAIAPDGTRQTFRLKIVKK